MKTHPLALLFPPMSPEEFDSLKESIRVSGLKEPVVTLEGQILDGAHRWRACQQLKIEAETRAYDEDSEGEPLQYVLAMNLARRHLNETQRGLVAARLANMPQGRPSKDEEKGPIGPFRVAEAAKLLSVGARTVKRSRRVLESGTPELVRAMERGDLRADAAARLVSLPRERQNEIAAEKDPKLRSQKIRFAKEEARRAPKKPLATYPGAGGFFTLDGGKTERGNGARTYNVEQWEALSGDEKSSIIEAGFGARAGMNEQQNDSIEWARRSLNTVTGCLHDCPYCYARDIAESQRMRAVYPEGFKPTFHPNRLSAPSRQEVPLEAGDDPSYRNIFANSMSDLFGRWVPEEWIKSTIEMARRNPQWNFLTLTKFPGRAAEFEFPDNWWMGTTVDAQARVAAAEKAFSKVKCKVRWLSVEPLLEPLKFERLELFQWMVIGGASSSSRTPGWIPPLEWIADLDVAARGAGVLRYYKTNTMLPDQLRAREFPWAKNKRRSLPKEFRYLKGMGDR